MRRLPRGINFVSGPTGVGCEEYMATAGRWLHLRRCAERGHVSCCETSPLQHAKRHAAETGHPVVASFEPLQGWFYDNKKRASSEALNSCLRALILKTNPPRPPAGRVPEDWESLLNDVADSLALSEFRQDFHGSHSLPPSFLMASPWPQP